MRIKQFILLILCFSLFTSPSSNAEIREIHQMSDILNEIDENTLILFDIDDTILISPSHFGSSPWWNYFDKTMNEAAKHLDSSKKAKVTSLIYSLTHKILKIVALEPIENNTPAIIKSLQESDHFVMALTARHNNPPYAPNFGQLTQQQLQSAEIDFRYLLRTEIKDFCESGILFTNHGLKGPIILAFLQKSGLQVSKVILIDDLEIQLKSVEKSLADTNYSFIGFRYSKADDQNLAFSPLLGNIQMHAFIENEIILSDEEAKQIAEKSPHLTPHFYIHSLLQKFISQ